METLKNKINDIIKTKTDSLRICPEIIFIKNEGEPYVKLYQNICDACNETIRHAWFPLSYILEINAGLRTLSKCDKCGVNDIVISLIIRKGDSWFTKVNKLEIIYI